MSRDTTPNDERTFFGEISDYEAAQNQLIKYDSNGSEDYSTVGELVKDITEVEDTAYNTAHAVARAFYQDNEELYNKNQLDIRDTAKEKVTKHNRPEWAWDILSFYAEDLGKRLLDTPSGGSHKGLLIEEDKGQDERRCYLYSKDANGISDVQHIERHHLNITNARSIGEEFPSETNERVALEINDDKIPAIQMGYNETMVPTDELSDYFESKVERPGSWFNQFQDLWSEHLNRSQSQETAESWHHDGEDFYYEGGESLFDLGDLVNQGMFFNGGKGEFTATNGNLAFEFPENWWEREEYQDPENIEEAAEKLYEEVDTIVVDSGEYIGEDSISEEGVFDKMVEEDPFLNQEQIEDLES